MKKIVLIIAIFCSFLVFSQEKENIDWINGKIYSSIFVYVKNDYDFAHNRLKEIDIAREKAKVNYYSILKKINLSESTPVLDYIENTGNKNRDLFSLIDNARLNKIEYPNINTIKVTYYINIYGENSLMSIVMNERDFFTEDLKGYMGFIYETNYTGVIIDARGSLTSFDGKNVKVEPSMFVTIKDSEGRIVFNQYNVLPSVIKNKGMIRYSYDVKENLSDRVGEKPLKIVAYGTGDGSGSIIVVSENDAKRMLASEKTRQSIKNGNIAVIIDP